MVKSFNHKDHKVSRREHNPERTRAREEQKNFVLLRALGVLRGKRFGSGQGEVISSIVRP
jgi:hypothetical protein